MKVTNGLLLECDRGSLLTYDPIKQQGQKQSAPTLQANQVVPEMTFMSPLFGVSLANHEFMYPRIRHI